MSYRRLPIFVVLCTLFFSCQKKDTAILNEEYDEAILSQYFDAATVGYVSTGETLTYIFKKNVSLPASFDTDKLISISPKVKGKVSMTNNLVLTFTPDLPLLSDTVYTITLHLSQLENPEYKNDITYKVRTIKQIFIAQLEGVVLEKNENMLVNIKLRTADAIAVDIIHQIVETDAVKVDIVETRPQEFDIRCQYGKNLQPNNFIHINTSKIGYSYIEKFLPHDFFKNEFGLLHTSYDSDQKAVHFYFSKRLNTRQTLNGLVTLNDKNPTTHVENNTLTVYLSESTLLPSNIIKIYTGIESEDGARLEKELEYTFEGKLEEPRAMFLDEGLYATHLGQYKIPIKTKALKKIHVTVIEIKEPMVAHYLTWNNPTYNETYTLRMYGQPLYDEVVDLPTGLKDENGWTVHAIDLSKSITKNPGSIYHISLGFTPSFTTLLCAQDLAKYDIKSKNIAASYFTKWSSDYPYYGYGYYDDYDWNSANNPCEKEYYINQSSVRKITLFTNVGVISKKSSDGYHFAITHLENAKPTKDAKIQLFDLQAQILGETYTDSDGFGHIPSFERDAGIAIISYDNEKTYIQLSPENTLGLSDFDLTGFNTPQNSTAFIYSTRDVWRPGDSIFVNILFNKNNISLPKGLPLIVKFYDINNIKISEKMATLDMDNHLIYTYGFATTPQAKTGQYRIKAEFGSYQIQKYIRVETIKPNTAEVKYTFENMIDGVVYGPELRGKYTATYLTGLEVKNSLIKAQMRYRNYPSFFNNYQHYSFDILLPQKLNDNILFETGPENSGTGSFSFYQDITFNTPQSVSIETDIVFKNGGTNKEGKSIIWSPLSHYIGARVKPGKGWSGGYTHQEKVVIDVVRLNTKGKKDNSTSKVNYTVYKHKTSWWIDKYSLSHNGHFQDDSYWSAVSSQSIDINGTTQIVLDPNTVQTGAFKVKIEDIESGHISEVFFTIYGDEDRIVGTQPHILTFDIEDKAYKIGDKIHVKLPPLMNAMGLISVEQGEKVLHKEWVNFDTKPKSIYLQTNELWAPNVFIHVSAIHPYIDRKHDLPLRMYGIKGVTIDGSVHRLQPIIQSPNTARADRTFEVTINEKTGEDMEYTLALVDEGLLNLTGFDTPNPHKAFYKKYPLSVKTWDIYDMMMAYFKGRYAGHILIGGDAAYRPDLLPEINRYKPVDLHYGPFKLAKNSTNKHKISIPMYIGKARLMVVACNKQKFGYEEKPILVQQPIMIQTQWPRTINVGDEIQVPVRITTSDNKIKQVKITPSSSLKSFVGLTPSPSYAITPQDAIEHLMKVTVPDVPGVVDLIVHAQGNGEQSKESTTLQIPYPNSIVRESTEYIIEPNESKVFSSNAKGYPNTYSSNLEINHIKLLDIRRYADELIQYPYGCLEQTTSAAFGQLYLEKIMALNIDQIKEKNNHIQAAINKLISFQKSNGHFNYWHNEYYDNWSDLYAGYFLTLAQQDQQIYNGRDMLQKWIVSQSSTAEKWSNIQSDYNNEYNILCQAFRLYILSLAGKPSKSAMNRFYNTIKTENSIVWWLMAGAYQNIGMTQKTTELITRAENLPYKSSFEYLSFGSTLRNNALKCIILSKTLDTKKLDTYYRALIDKANNKKYMNTQEMGFLVLATHHYLLNKNISPIGNVSFELTSQNGIKTYLLTKGISHISKIEPGKNITIKNTGNTPLFVHQSEKYIPRRGSDTKIEESITMHVEYVNTTQNNTDVQSISLGDDITMRITIKNTLDIDLEHIALNVKMPSGFELINDRILNPQKSASPEFIIYQDFRDDRVYSFLKLEAKKTVVVTFKTKAAYKGKFMMPSIICEDMYNPQHVAKIPATTLRIK